MVPTLQTQPDRDEYPEARNPFFTAETGDRESLARWMLEAADEPEAP